MLNYNFPVRKDKNGIRYIFFLGNEGGNCKYNCTFCEIGKSSPVTSEYNIRLFDELFKDYLEKTNGKTNHPLLYNRGNITDERSFSRRTLLHIFKRFRQLNNISYLSINSREKEADKGFLNLIIEEKMPFPIHFILGLESFSLKLKDVIGKKSDGELLRLIERLNTYNKNLSLLDNKKYLFGIDVNILFLPELYIGKKRQRNFHETEIKNGLMNDIEQVLKFSNDITPVNINIHPYYKVKSLPYEDADIEQLISLLPEISEKTEKYNYKRKYKTSVFIGFRGGRTGDVIKDNRIMTWTEIINLFNETGKIKKIQLTLSSTFAIHTSPTL